LGCHLVDTSGRKPIVRRTVARGVSKPHALRGGFAIRSGATACRAGSRSSATHPCRLNVCNVAHCRHPARRHERPHCSVMHISA
jgi:hypothetical protein